MPFDLKSALKEMSESEIAQYLLNENGYTEKDYASLKENNFTDADINRNILKMEKTDYEDVVTRNFNEQNMGDVQRGVVRGAHGIASSTYGMAALGGNVLQNMGAEDTGKAIQGFGMEGYKEHEHEASLHPKDKFSDSKIGWALGTGAELIPIMTEVAIGSALGGGAGLVAGKQFIKQGMEVAIKKGIKKQATKIGAKTGVAAGIFPLETGSMYGELRNEHGVKAPWSAVFFGSLATALEFTGGNVRLIDTMFDAVKNGKGSITKAIAKQLIKTMPAEALQEAGQETFAILNVVANTDEKLLTKDNFLRIGESAGAGAVGGFMGAVPHGVISGIKEKKNPPPTADDEPGGSIPIVEEEEVQADDPRLKNAFNVLAKDTKKELGDIEDKSVKNLNAFMPPVQKKPEAPHVETQSIPQEPIREISEEEQAHIIAQGEIDQQNEIDAINAMVGQDDPFMSPKQADIEGKEERTTPATQKVSKRGEDWGRYDKKQKALFDSGEWASLAVSEKTTLGGGKQEAKKMDEGFVDVEHRAIKTDEGIIIQQRKKPEPKEPGPEHEVSPEEVETDPTDAQKEAGNYKKVHIKIDNFDISIENPDGSVRKGTNKSGKKWESKMHGHYGYFKRTLGKDGDQVDVVVKPKTETSPKVFVVDQVNEQGQFDEHKVIMGTESAKEAKDLYLSNYEKGWNGFGEITEMDTETFRGWVKDGKRTKKPLAGGLDGSFKNSKPLDAHSPDKKVDGFQVGQAVSWDTKTKGVQSGTIVKKEGKNWRVKKDDTGRETLIKEPFVKKEEPEQTKEEMLDAMDSFFADDKKKKPEAKGEALFKAEEITEFKKYDIDVSGVTPQYKNEAFQMLDQAKKEETKLADPDYNKNVQAEYDRIEEEQKGTEPKSNKGIPKDTTSLVGKNKDGENVYQDKDGMRSYEASPGIIVHQKGRLVPGGVSTFDSLDTLFEKKSYEMLTSEEIDGFVDSYEPPSDWRGNLIKAREYAARLIDGGRIDYKKAKEAWTDRDGLVSLIDETTGVEALDAEENQINEDIKETVGDIQPEPQAKSEPEKKPTTKEKLKAEWDKQAQAQKDKEKIKAAKDKIKESAGKMMDDFKAINALFGERGSFSTEELDENIYAQVKDRLNSAWGHAKDTGKSIAEFVAVAIENLSHKATPYFHRWVDEEVTEEYDGVKTKEGIENGNADNNRRASVSGSKKEDDISSPGSKSAEDVPAAKENNGPESILDADGKSVDGGLRSGERSSVDDVQDKSTGKRKSSKRSTGDGDGATPGVGGSSGKPSGIQRRGRDHRIEPGSIDRSGGWKKTAESNLAAIALYKKIVEEKRFATQNEQKILAQYVGWGSSELANNMFPGYAQQKEVLPNWASYEWKDSVTRLTKLLTPEEIKTAAKSTQYAHYTSEKVITSIYKALNDMGFKGGKILEPGMGVGNFVGLLPEKMRKYSKYTGIEMDHVSAGIAKLLYPNQNIMQADFTKQSLPKNFFDAAIGNPPFGSIPILADPEYRKHSFSLHNYFFAKAIDRVRPGGLLVFVTSRYTMDAVNDRARKYMTDRADLVGAIRLPQTAFKKNAGTDVVTDVLFLKKREKNTKPSGEAWAGTTGITLKDSLGNDKDVQINEYFKKHPEMVLGQNSLAGKMYSKNEYTVMPLDGDIEDHFGKAIKRLPKKIYSATTAKEKAVHDAKEIIERDFNPKNKKEGGLYIGKDDKTLMQVNFGSGVALSSRKKISARDAVMLKDCIGLRDKIKLSHHAQLNDGDWKAALKDLQGEYKKFVKKHGNIHAYNSAWKTVKNEDGTKEKVEERRYKKKSTLRHDAEYTLVWQLEKILDDGNIVKSSILKDRTIMRPVTPKIKTVPDALAVSLNSIGHLDLDHVAELAGKPAKETLEVLGDLIYKAPDNEEYVLADEYLSGDVVTKLEEATLAVKLDPEYQRNVKALKAVQPDPLSSSDISVMMGGTWIPSKYYNEFARDVLGIRSANLSYDKRIGTWGLDYRGAAQGLRSASDDWSTTARGKNEILMAVVNNNPIRITAAIETADGGKRTIVDQEATTEANEKASKMRKEFSSWVWRDMERSTELLDLYNRKYNNLAPRKFDGSHLTLPGVTTKISLYQHQKDAIWRIIQSGNTYLNHAVGSGKTFTMIAAGMEMKRLGMVRKPMYVVPNHMLGQFSQEFQELYPMANIMVADEVDFKKENRKNFVSQATLNSPDAVIMTHSSFNLIKSNEENIKPVRKEFIGNMEYALETMQDEDAPRMKIKKMESMIEKAEQRFDSLIGEGDDVVSFEDMGIDFLFVDEAHEFRKLDFATNRQVKGIDTNGSKKAIDLYIKTLWLSSINKDRSHVFASGTPIVNTIGEMYTINRFFDRNGLDSDGLEHFDAWASMFGLVASDYEMNSAGRYEVVERFSKFVNIPEMMSRVRRFTDVLTSKQLGTRVKRPKIKGGSPEIVATSKTPELLEYQTNVLQPRIETSRKWKPSKEQPGNPDPLINIITDGRLAAIDIRFVENGAKSNPDSKLNKYIDDIIKSYKETKDNQYLLPGSEKKSIVPGGGIICFYNVGFGKNVAATRGFNARAWATKRFTEAGIPGSHVAWIDDYNTAEKKQGLFKAVREGKKRIMLGSAKKMGTGVNAQTRLTNLHYLDPPWFPADVEQPQGRIVRQGNQNEEVSIKWYATEGSYDSTMWQMVARKSRFIEQAWAGEKGVRTIEDVSKTSQYAMASALASGDQRLIQMVGLQADVKRLETLSVAHRRNQGVIARSIKDNGWDIERYEKRLKTLQKAQEKFPEYISKLDATIGKKKFDNKKDFNQALKVAVKKAVMTKDGKFKAAKKVEIADINGAKIIVVIEKGWQEFQMTASLGIVNGFSDIIGESRIYEGRFNEYFDDSNIATKSLNMLNRIPSAISTMERQIKDKTEENERAQKLIGLPFENLRELNEKHEELRSLEKELEDEGKEVSPEELGIGEADTEDNDTPTKLSTSDDIKPLSRKEILEGIRDQESGLAYIDNKGNANWTGRKIPTKMWRRLEDEGAISYVPGDDIWVDSSIYDKKKGQVDTSVFSTDQLPGQGVSLKDIQSRFKGQKVFISKDGQISIRLKNGHGLRIVRTNDMGKGDTQFAIETGRMGKDGIILGKYKRDTITLNKDLASNFTRDHELGHFLIDNGMLTQSDLFVLDGKIAALKKKGQLRFKLGKDKEENRVNALAQLLEDREQYRGTAIGKILQKIADIIDGFFHIASMTERKMARQVESGGIFSREASQKGSKEGKFQTTADLEYEEQEDTFIQKATDLYTGLIKHRKDKGKNYNEDISAMAHIFKTTMYNAEKIGGAYKRLWNVIRKQNDHKFNAQRDLWYEGDHSLLETFKAFAKKHKEEYAEIKEYLTQRDIEKKGFLVKKDNDEFTLLHWKKKNGVRKIIGTYGTKEAAWEDGVLIEAEESGFSPEGQEALIAFRKMSHNLYHHFAINLEESIAAYEKAGQPLPQITIQTEEGVTQIDLRAAAERMGDLRGSYFPRLRNSGKWRVIGHKKGSAKQMQFFDTRRLPGGANAYRAGLERKGFKTEIEKVGKLSEDLFQSLEPLLAQQQILNKAMKDISNEGKQRILEDANIKAKWEGDTFILYGALKDDIEESVRHLGGKFKERWLKNTYRPEIAFEDIEGQDPYEFEQKVTSAILHSGGLEVDMDLAFADAMVKQYDAILKGRGARSRMLARSDSIGMDVVQGYELDPVTAITSAMQAAAGSKAKAIIAKEGSAAISGRDIKWKDFKEEKKGPVEDLEGDLAELNLNSPADEKLKGDLLKQLQGLRRDLESNFNPTPNYIITKQRQIKKIQDKLKTLGKWSDVSKARKIQQNITQAKTGLYEEYLALVDKRKLDAKTQAVAHKEATAALKDILRNEEFADRVLGVVKGVAVWQYLGLRVSSAAVNVTNMAFGVPAAMNGETDNQVSLKKAIGHIVRSMKNFSLHRANKLEGEQKNVFDEIKLKGWDAPVFNREAFDVLSSKLGKGWNWALEKSMWMFGKAEELNRASTIAATYFAMKEVHKGEWDHAAMMEKSKEISDKAHGDYSKANRPYQMRGGNLAGRVLQASYVFHTFEHNYMQEMFRLGWDKKQYKAAAYMAFAPAIFGIGATLPIGVAKAISNVLGGDDPEEGLIKLAESSFGMGDIARNGIMGIGDHGVNLRGSLATRFGVPSAFYDIFGAPGSVVADWIEGGKNITKGHFQEGFEKMAPAAIANISKGIRESTTGVTTRTGSPVFWGREQLKGDTIDMILRMLSFNPTNVSTKKEIQWGEYKTQTRYRTKKSEIIKRFKAAMNKTIEKRSRHDILKIKADIRDFNSEIRDKKLTRLGLLITEKSIKDAMRRNVKAPKRERLRDL